MQVIQYNTGALWCGNRCWVLNSLHYFFYAFMSCRYYYLSPLIVSAVIVLTLPGRKRTKDPKED